MAQCIITLEIPQQFRRRRFQLLAVVAFVLFGAIFAIALFLNNERLSNHLQGGYDSKKNVSYCNSHDPEQVLDVYMPANSTDTITPVVAYVHGGGWRAGKRNNALIRHYTSLFLSKGIAVVDIGYRLDASHPYPDQNNDVACALHYLTTHQELYEIDMARLDLFGDSAGGQLVAATALSYKSAKYSYPKPKGVIDFYGVSDFTKIVSSARPDKSARFYLGKYYQADAAKASPISMVTADAPPFLIVHGKRDGVVPVAQSQELYQKLLANGVYAQLYIVPGARHGLIGPELSSTENNKIETMMTDFLTRTLGVTK